MEGFPLNTWGWDSYTPIFWTRPILLNSYSLHTMKPRLRTSESCSEWSREKGGGTVDCCKVSLFASLCLSVARGSRTQDFTSTTPCPFINCVIPVSLTRSSCGNTIPNLGDSKTSVKNVSFWIGEDWLYRYFRYRKGLSSLNNIVEIYLELTR